MNFGDHGACVTAVHHDILVVIEFGDQTNMLKVERFVSTCSASAIALANNISDSIFSGPSDSNTYFLKVPIPHQRCSKIWLSPRRQSVRAIFS